MTAVVNPNLGLFFNLAPLAVPEGGLSAGMNFRVKDGRLSNLNLGWSNFEDLNLDSDPVTLITTYRPRTGAPTLVLANTDDLFYYDTGDQAVYYITPKYSTGAATSGGTTVEFAGGTDLVTAGIKAGDKIAFLSANENDPAATWYTIDSVTDADTLELTSAASVHLGVDFTIRKLFTGTLDNRWQAVNFQHEATGDEDWLIMTNGVDDVVYWNGTGFAEDMGLSFKAQAIAVYKNQLICAGITDSGEFLPGQMRNSDIGDPDDFGSGLSEIFTLHADNDGVTRILPLGDSLVFYSERHTVVADFVGDPLVFVFRTASSDIGPLAGGLVADHTEYHALVGADSAYLFDGATFVEHGVQVMRNVIGQRDPNRMARGFAQFDEENGDLLWALPLTSDETEGPAVAWAEHYLEDTGRTRIRPFSVREFPFTTTGYYERAGQLAWDDLTGMWSEYNFRWNDVFFAAAFPLILAGDEDGWIYSYGTQQSADGTLLPSYVRFGRKALGDGRMRGLLTRLYPFASRFPETTLLVRTRLFDSAGGPLTTTDEQQFSLELPEGGHFVSIFRCARFFETEFATDGNPWQILGYDMDMREGGYR